MNKSPVRYTKYRRARDKALSRLASAHPEQYKQYLEEERASCELDKGGVTGVTSGSAGGVDIRTAATTTRPSSSNDSENEGNYGGEA